MTTTLGIIFLVILIALVFEYINGFHDTANCIATVVGTKVLTPRQAILLAAVTNLIGALAGHAVAKTISSGLVDAQFVSPQIIICALLGGIVWNLITWWFGLPSSSTHALVGGVCGAAVAAAHNDWNAIIWSVEKIKDGKVVMEGVLHKVIFPMVTSPLIGFVGGFLIMGVLYALLRSARPRFVNRFFGKAQIVSAAYMGFAHGLADAQKTMGIITLALASATATGSFIALPDSLGFLKMGKSKVAEHSIQVLLRTDASPEELRAAANALEEEGSRLEPEEFREAFLTLSAITHAELGDPVSNERVADLASATHKEILVIEEARILPKIPLIGLLAATYSGHWEKILRVEMDAAGNAGKNRLHAAAARVSDLSPDVPIWVKIICSLTMAAGTMAGGWRIIKTLGHKIVRLQPVHGFAAEATAATVLAVTGGMGMAVSTTHCVTTAIMGVGCAKRFNALKLSLVERILWAWILTLPSAGVMAYLFVEGFRLCGWIQ